MCVYILVKIYTAKNPAMSLTVGCVCKYKYTPVRHVCHLVVIILLVVPVLRKSEDKVMLHIDVDSTNEILYFLIAPNRTTNCL